MGKGTDKLYITHSEWSSDSAYSASHGSGVTRANAGENSTKNAFKRLPYNYCALSLRPWNKPVCTPSGTIYDLENIVSSLAKQGTNAKDPVSGLPLKRSDLVELHFSQNVDGDYADPVTGKVFTPNTHIVAISKSGNVFAWDTIERLNIKAKNWRDLVTDEEFGRKDLITLQDPMSIDGKGFKAEKREDEQKTVASDKIEKAKEAVARAKAQREQGVDPNKSSSTSKALSKSKIEVKPKPSNGSKPLPYNAAQHTTGKAAASFTSTYMTPHTSADRALLSEEEYMLKPKRVKEKGYATLQTSLGDLSLELYPEYAPKAVWNFIRLAQKGYYRGLKFHRNIRNFMIQGGDPTGTGRGGESIWGKTFADEFDPHMVHDSRGVLSMANKGKDTNSSQFFITYRPAKHLDRKHTVFGKVVGGLDVLSALEAAKTDEKTAKPVEDLILVDVVVLIDPFEEFLKQKEEKEKEEKEKEEIKRKGGAEEDRVTWTGKRIREDGTVEDSQKGGVGRYLAEVLASRNKELATVEGDETFAEPARKKVKSAGFGNFDNW